MATTATDNKRRGRLADATGEVFGTRARGTWVRVRQLPLENYAENGDDRPKEELEQLMLNQDDRFNR